MPPNPTTYNDTSDTTPYFSAVDSMNDGKNPFLTMPVSIPVSIPVTTEYPVPNQDISETQHKDNSTNKMCVTSPQAATTNDDASSDRSPESDIQPRVTIMNDNPFLEIPLTECTALNQNTPETQLDSPNLNPNLNPTPNPNPNKTADHPNTIQNLKLEDYNLHTRTSSSEDQTASASMALNTAFEALEQMRKANLEIEFTHAIDFDCCVHCLRGRSPRKRIPTNSRFAHPKRSHKPCLMCGSPTCQRHASRTFRKSSKIVICSGCGPLFKDNFVLECVGADGDGRRREMIGRMVDVYDRVSLVLRYSVQFIDDIVGKLEKTSKQRDRVGIGGTTSGLFSGIAGVAAAAAILTPAGPPLLIASLLFGGTAQVCHAGTKTVNYYSTPRRLATRIIAYYNLCKSVLFVTCVLRDALLKDRLDLENYVENIIKGVEEMKDDYGYGGSFDNDDEEADNEEDEDTDQQSLSDTSTTSADTEPSTLPPLTMTSFDEKAFSSEAPTAENDTSASIPTKLQDRFSATPTESDAGAMILAASSNNELVPSPVKTSHTKQSSSVSSKFQERFSNRFSATPTESGAGAMIQAPPPNDELVPSPVKISQLSSVSSKLQERFSNRFSTAPTESGAGAIIQAPPPNDELVPSPVKTSHTKQLSSVSSKLQERFLIRWFSSSTTTEPTSTEPGTNAMTEAASTNDERLISPGTSILTKQPHSPEQLLPKAFFDIETIDEKSTAATPYLSTGNSFDIQPTPTPPSTPTTTPPPKDLKIDTTIDPDTTKITVQTPPSNNKYGATARYMSRTSLASSGLAGVANVAAVAGGALSIVHIAFEVKSLASTFKRMQRGSPCERARTLRKIKVEYGKFPTTEVVVQQWERNLRVLEGRKGCVVGKIEV